jgi:hypothetical protein
MNVSRFDRAMSQNGQLYEKIAVPYPMTCPQKQSRCRELIF